MTEEKLTMEALKAELANSTGTEQYHKDLSGMLFTDGIAVMAEKAKAFWLITDIGSYEKATTKEKYPFQLWTLKVKKGKAVLAMQEDSNTPVLIKQNIPYTDFPEGEISFYVEDGILLLPSEH